MQHAARFDDVPVTDEDVSRLNEVSALQPASTFVVAAETGVMEETIVIDGAVKRLGWTLLARVLIRIPDYRDYAWSVTAHAPHHGYTIPEAQEKWGAILMDALADGVLLSDLLNVTEDNDDSESE